MLAWNNALVLAPGDPRGHNNLDTLAVAGRVDEALPEFEESVELSPQRRRWGESGECAGRHGRAPGGSHSTLNQGIELQPESASAQNGLGVALARAVRLEDAVVQMDKAVVLAPQAVDYRYNFACVLAANDSRPRAVVQFEEAARLWNAGTCNSGDACGYLIPTPDAIPEAVSTARRALDLATKRQDDSLVVRMKASPGRSEGLARGGLRLRQRLNEVPRG